MIPIQTLRAPNPSAFTGSGTNTYIVGEDQPLIVDPGPDLHSHRQAILTALAGRRPAAILVTHPHLDHSALAPEMGRLTEAPVLAFGTALSGFSARMRALAAEGLTGGEGSDLSFVPDQTLADGQILDLCGMKVEVLHTPGHMASHVSFALDDVLLSGDHVMGWSTSIVSPPEGDMTAYMQSLAALQTRDWRRFLPGHGDAIETPALRLAELLVHRKLREAAILESLTTQGPANADGLARRVYATTPPALLPAAARNVLAHLIDLQARGLVAAEPGPLGMAVFLAP